MQNYFYDGTFFENILIAGKTACGKTYFTQKLTLNNAFGELKKVEWVSYMQLNSEREAEIKSCFSCPVEFHYPKELEKFNDLLEVFKAHYLQQQQLLTPIRLMKKKLKIVVLVKKQNVISLLIWTTFLV